MEWTTIILILLVFFVLFIAFLVILSIIAFFFGRKELQKRIYKFLKPDPNDIQQDMNRLQLKYPNMNADAKAAAYIKDQAKFLALVGFLTEIPLLGAVLDISYTTLRQMKMLHVLTALYGNNRLDPEELEMRYMAMVGGSNLSLRLIVKFITGEIPIVSGLINAGINWFATKKIGEIGIGWNKEETLLQIAKRQTLEAKEKALSAGNTAFNTVNSKLHREKRF